MATKLRNTHTDILKKTIAVLLIFIAFSCDEIVKKNNTLLDYIPRDSQVIIKINTLEGAASALRDNHLVKNNEPIAFFNYFKNLPVLKTSSQPEGLLCFSPLGKNDYEYTYISKFDPSLIQNDSLNTKKIDKISYSNQTIYKVTSKGNSFFATQKDSILVASSSQLLIENAIRTQTTPIPVDPDLEKAYQVSGTENAISVLVNGKKLQNIHNSLLPETDLKGLQNFSGWISMDATVDQNAIFLDGIAIEKDSLSSTIGIFDNTLAQENKIAKITPVTAKGFISYTYDNYDILKKNVSIAQDRAVEDIPTDLDDILSEVSEIGIIFLEKENALVLNTLDVPAIEESLAGDKVETHRNISIYAYKNIADFAQVLHPLIQDFESKFYFTHDQFVVFGSSINALKDIIASIQNQTMLGDQEYYTSTIKNLSDESSILIAGTTDHIKNYISENAQEAYSKPWEEFKSKGYHIGIVQMIKENDFAHIHSVLQKNKAKGAATSVTQVASTSLEDKVLKRPILVKNHRTKGMDVAVQDIENNLYLISDTGSIFWKKQIDGEIIGDIKQIDIYKNGRYQLLFNTVNTLYLVDRNGKDVAPYPKKFNEPVTQPLALFDYDKSKRYRIVTTHGNAIKMFDAKAKIVEGFKFKNTETNLILPPKHIRIGSKDYILLAEENGKLTILDRIGRARVNVKEKIDFSKNQWYQYLDKFTSTTKNGSLIQIQNDGNAVKQNLGLQGDNSIVATNKTLVTFSENKLTIKGKTLELDFGVYTAPQLYYINNKIYITITDKQAKKVYLYDSNGELFPNFPVYGNSIVSLGNMDKDPNLEFVVQGEENEILIYQIN